MQVIRSRVQLEIRISQGYVVAGEVVGSDLLRILVGLFR